MSPASRPTAIGATIPSTAALTLPGSCRRTPRPSRSGRPRYRPAPGACRARSTPCRPSRRRAAVPERDPQGDGLGARDPHRGSSGSAARSCLADSWPRRGERPDELRLVRPGPPRAARGLGRPRSYSPPWSSRRRHAAPAHTASSALSAASFCVRAGLAPAMLRCWSRVPAHVVELGAAALELPVGVPRRPHAPPGRHPGRRAHALVRDRHRLPPADRPRAAQERRQRAPVHGHRGRAHPVEEGRREVGEVDDLVQRRRPPSRPAP